ncbi:hypothetical protein FQN60_003254 [Etheostoma spectabile]|uniref:SOCS box domain-containing protein n=1 Tax=Etheostoma spectabile TaxID=54343 RepID=A0A5J5CLP8_9PERO|nr:hypothetical protein FQN60_003254 [Etheostoma spectabile]
MSHCKTVYRTTTSRHAEKRQELPGSAFGLERNTARDRCHGSDPDEGQGGMGRPDDDTGSLHWSKYPSWLSSQPPWTMATSTNLQDAICVNQISGVESEVDYLESSQAVSEAVALPSTVPVIGESFCQCDRQKELGLGFCVTSDCLCGEEDEGFDWEWDEHYMSSGAFLSCNKRKVSFHSDYSCGTAAIRGTKELSDGQHFWEVKMTSPVYGTDMMVGIGTSELDLEKFKFSFGSLLGHDEDSWGLSYTGQRGSIIGVHLDTWHGTLTFYKNRHCLAAKSSMKVIRACYTPTSLQYLCCAQLRQMLPCCPDVLNAIELPPGLRTLLHLQLGWVFTLSSSPEASEQHEDSLEDFYEGMSLPSSPIPSPASTLSACASPSPCTSPFLDTVPYQCPCHMSPQTQPCTCHSPPTPPSSDYDSCCSEPEDYQCKRSRWT